MTRNDETVCQEALALIRQETALTPGFSDSSYTGTLTKAERASLRTFDYVRRAFLAAHDWNFARAWREFDGTRGQALRILDCEDASGTSVGWRLDGQSVVAPGAARMVYTADIEDTSAWPPLVRAAFVAELARELCLPVSGRMEDLKAIDAIAKEREDAARLADLREGSPDGADTFEVAVLLARDVPAWRMKVYLQSAAEEVLAAHDWGEGATSLATLPVLARKAAIVLAAAKAAGYVGADAAGARNLRAHYAEKLLAARIWALEHEQPADPLAAEVAAVLRPMQNLPPEALPRSIASRVAELKESARREVLSAHRWNFARTVMPVHAACGRDGWALIARPPDCARVESVRAADGGLADWSMRGEFIAARGAVESISYIRDADDLETWPPAPRLALVYRLAADIAAQGGNERWEARYRQKLSEGALADAREGNPGRSAWGRGRFAAAMGGGFESGR